MKKVRIGLIGLGGICNGAHIPGYLKLDNAEITAVCDINPEKLEKVGDKLGIPADHFAGKRVVIKPNLVAAMKPGAAATTHPVFLCAVVDFLRE